MMSSTETFFKLSSGSTFETLPNIVWSVQEYSELHITLHGLMLDYFSSFKIIPERKFKEL